MWHGAGFVPITFFVEVSIEAVIRSCDLDKLILMAK
jgi:hypothetical protein